LTSTTLPDIDEIDDILPDILDKKQIKLLNIATKIALLCFIVMISSFLYQFVWFIGLEINGYSKVIWFNYSWCLDGLLVIICVYLQTGVLNAKSIYNVVCVRCLKCHRCTFNVIKIIATQRTNFNIKKQRTVRNESDSLFEQDMIESTVTTTNNDEIIKQI